MHRARISAMVLALLAACREVDDPPVSPAPSNKCQPPLQTCDAYAKQQQGVSCTAGNLCAVQNVVDAVLIVSIPGSSSASPNQTFTSSYRNLLAIKQAKGVGCSASLCLPPLGESAGTYQVKPSTANDQVHFYLGRDAVDYTIPIHVTMRPLWKFDANEKSPGIDAPLIGLPLFPSFGRVALGDQPGLFGPGDPPTESITYSVTLPAGDYERSMFPDPPFDRAFPPFVDVVRGEAAGASSRLVLGGTVAAPGAVNALVDTHEITVTRNGGDLQGWTVYLRDIVTERRISTMLTLEGAGGAVSLFTANQGGPQGAEIRDGVQLVVAPPKPSGSDLVLPEYTLAAVANSVPKIAEYPKLPPQVLVKGFVGDANNARVNAHVLLQSTEIQPSGDDSSKRDLHLSVAAVTDAEGRYALRVPPGKYSAIITPSISSGFAKAIVPLFVGDTPLTQEGKKLEVSKTVLLRGVCTLSDGRPVADAEVEGHASSSLLVALPLTERDRSRWPRTFVTRTQVQGEFALPVDPGTYDIVVRPAAGTRFPWLVAPQQIVVSGAVQTEPLALQVRAPRYLPLTLNDNNNNAIVNALVRVYVAHTVVGGTVGLEVARTRTGPRGAFELFLDPLAK